MKYLYSFLLLLSSVAALHADETIIIPQEPDRASQERSEKAAQALIQQHASPYLEPGYDKNHAPTGTPKFTFVPSEHYYDYYNSGANGATTQPTK
jgi:hypothetical protein